jgi:hypothetical protein
MVIGSRRRVLRQFVNKDGRHVVILYRDGKSFSKRVHVLVLESFRGPRPIGMLGIHGPNGNGDNSLKNVRWGTYSDNNGKDRYRDGTEIVGSNLPWTKLSERQVLEIWKKLKSGIDALTISKQYGVTRRLIYNIKHGGCWKWLTQHC